MPDPISIAIAGQVLEEHEAELAPYVTVGRACIEGGGKGDKTQIPLSLKMTWARSFLELVERRPDLGHSAAAKQVVKAHNRKHKTSYSERKAPDHVSTGLAKVKADFVWQRDPRGRKAPKL